MLVFDMSYGYVCLHSCLQYFGQGANIASVAVAILALNSWLSSSWFKARLDKIGDKIEAKVDSKFEKIEAKLDSSP